MTPEKKLLSVEEIEAQTALELPDRQMLALVAVSYGSYSKTIFVKDKDLSTFLAYCQQAISAGYMVSCQVVG